MRASGRVGGWLAVAAFAAAGCHTLAPVTVNAPPIHSPPAPPDLPAAMPGSLEPDYKSLPSADPPTEKVPPAIQAGVTYRGLSEEVCRALAAAHSPSAAMIEREGEVPPAPPANRREARRSPPSTCDSVSDELRAYAAEDARNTSAADALEQFYRLADAEGRSELVRATVPLIDDLRARVKKARTEGLKVPTDPEEIDRQRAQVLALIAQADLGTAMLNIDLKRRIGMPGNTPDRLWPTGPFPLSADPVDAEAAVQVALERRADLKLLRAAYLRLSPETLPTIRDILGKYEPRAAALGQHATAHHVRGKRAEEAADAQVQAELAVRRQQLFELTATRERQAADEVRAAAATLNAQTRQVALSRWRAEHLAARVKDAKKQGPLAELPAEIEVVRARADVVAAVFTWHQARVKLLGAQGLLAGPP